jgi:hypothetical protein
MSSYNSSKLIDPGGAGKKGGRSVAFKEVFEAKVNTSSSPAGNQSRSFSRLSGSFGDHFQKLE